ncbi:MAG: NAD-dependent dehydratase [Chryseobacterium sp.]|nr:MAG: NAD-dependent dehydratase [Chryseobacterium sp.]
MEAELVNDEAVWAQIAQKYSLKEHNLNKLASAWHTDLDLGRPIEVMTDMSKSRKLGFLNYQDTKGSFFDLFEKLRMEKLIPDF